MTNRCLTAESGKRVQRSAAVSTSTTTHTPSEDVYTNGVEATETPQKDRTKCAPLQHPPRERTPDARPFTAHLELRATHPSSAPSLKCARCRPPSGPRCFSQKVMEVGLLPFLHPLVVIQLLACASQPGCVVVGDHLMDVFLSHYGATPPENSKFLRQNADNSKSKGTPVARVFVQLRMLRTMQGVRAGPCNCHWILRALWRPREKKTTPKQHAG